MEIKTASGAIKINKATPYGKWLRGYVETDAWTGHATMREMWRNYEAAKPAGCSWKAWGLICAKYFCRVEH